MNRREMTLKVGLLITLLLCTASKGYEIYVGSQVSNGHTRISNSNKEQCLNVIYYRVSVACGEKPQVLSNVCGVMMDDKNQACVTRNFERGEFEIIQKAAASMSEQEVAELQREIFTSSDEEYVNLIKKLINDNRGYYVKIPDKTNGEG